MIKLNKTTILATLLILSSGLFAETKTVDTNKTKIVDTKKAVKTVVKKAEKKEDPKNSAELMSKLADKFIELEKQKNKNTLSKDGKILTPQEKAKLQTEQAIVMDGLESKRMTSKFQIQKQFPMAVGYFKIAGKKYATVDYNGKKFNIQEKNWIGGFKLVKIYENRLRFITPSGKMVSSYYETINASAKKRR